MKVRVLIADSCCVVREGLRALLKKTGSVRVVAEARNAEETIRQARKHRPHVILLEATMPGMGGAGVAKAILAQQPLVRIIGLNMRAEEKAFDAMFGAGVVGFMFKDVDSEEIVVAIKDVLSGDVYVGKSISQLIAKETVLARLGKARPSPDLSRLTRREREVSFMGEICAKKVATELGISVRTVEAYRRQIKAKLGLDWQRLAEPRRKSL